MKRVDRPGLAVLVGVLAVLLAACGGASGGAPVDEPPSPTATPEPAPAGGGAACLQGVWTMSNADLNEMLAGLVPAPNLSAPQGTPVLTLDGDRYSYIAEGLVVRVTLAPDWYMEAEGGFTFTGAFSADGEMMEFVPETGETELAIWRAYKDGQLVEMPGTAPELSLGVSGAAPYRCMGDRLEIDSAGGGAGPVIMFFSRTG